MSIEVIGIIPIQVFPVSTILTRFSADERVAIRQSPSLYVQDWWEVLYTKESVDVKDLWFTDGVNLLVADGLLSEERKGVIEGVVYK